MSPNSQLGLHWGTEAFYFVEEEKGQIKQALQTPFDAPLGSEDQDEIPQGLKFTHLIQKTFKENGITTKKVGLSIPGKDLIFRSFVIPWMQSEEILDAVSFEITKYIPIPLENLSYTFHPAPFSDGNQKSIRILFVAIRKDILSNYTDILEHSGLKIAHIEPAPVCLARVLKKQKAINPKQSVAVVQLTANKGEITIIADDVVQFVREFSLSLSQQEVSSVTSGLLNDIRVSFNYFNRQNPQERIQQIIVLSSFDLNELNAKLEEEFELPVKTLRINDLAPKSSLDHPEMLPAFGIALREPAFSTKNFDLSPKDAAAISRLSSIDPDGKRYKIMAAVVLLSILSIYLTQTLTKRIITDKNTQLAELTAQQGKFEGVKTSKVEEMSTKLNNELVDYQDVTSESDLTYFLETLPALLPEGMWVRSLKVNYYNKQTKDKKHQRNIPKVMMNIDGYAYTEDTNEQFRLVNTFVATLKENEKINRIFESIDLESVRSDTFEEYPVTFFNVKCE